VNNGSDSWFIILPNSFIVGQNTWAEPGSATTGNQLSGVPGINAGFTVLSDFGPPTANNANGGTDTTSFTDDDNPLSVTFTDNAADSPTVPEPSTLFAGALLLLPFGISALRGLLRNRAQ
jgi:hypothetical protein